MPSTVKEIIPTLRYAVIRTSNFQIGNKSSTKKLESGYHQTISH